MKYRYLLLIFLVHWGLGLAGFMGISAWAIALQDAEPLVETGSYAASLRWFELLLRYGLLQPLAHWVLRALQIDWWVWSGLIQLAVVLAANSLIVVGLAAAASRHVHAWRSRRQTDIPIR